MEPTPDALSLYIHWPYCARICPYCDFNVVRARDTAASQASQRVLFDAVLADLHRQAEGLGDRHLVSLFFGGGTPSLLPPDGAGDLIAAAKNLFPPKGDIEITLEANPTDAEIARYEGFRAAGVNRLSLGVQALDDEALQFLGRNHSARDAIRGIEVAQAVFGRVSLDLIYALPGQTPDAWDRELRRAVALGVEHISPYQLTIEHSTAFGRAVRRGVWSPPDQDLGEALYDRTQTTLTELGFEAYEVSNHARGAAARSAHNIFVWEGVDYMGIGPGAHGRLTRNGVRHATVAEPDLKTYVAAGDPIAATALSPQEAEEEALMLGLRLIDGVRLERVPNLNRKRADDLIADGFLEQTHERLRATDTGRVVLDRLLLELLS